jgi:predicted aconitase with swiveling domain
MAESFILKKCRVAVSGNLEAEALVSPTPFSFMLSVDTNTGIIIEEGHPHKGETITGKVLVYPNAKGSSGDCLRLWRCSKNNVAPAAIITGMPDPVHVQGGLITNIPFVIAMDTDIASKIKTGDRIRIDGEKVEVTSLTEGAGAVK